MLEDLELEEELTCNICYKLMTSPPHENQPKVLNCSHTFCLNCMQVFKIVCLTLFLLNINLRERVDNVDQSFVQFVDLSHLLDLLIFIVMYLW